MERTISDCEKKVEELELKIKQIEVRLSSVEGASDSSLYEKHGRLKKELDEIIEKWTELTMELEEKNKQI